MNKKTSLIYLKEIRVTVCNEIADYVIENKGDLVSANLDILIQKKNAYDLVINDVEHRPWSK